MLGFEGSASRKDAALENFSLLSRENLGFRGRGGIPVTRCIRGWGGMERYLLLVAIVFPGHQVLESRPRSRAAAGGGAAALLIVFSRLHCSLAAAAGWGREIRTVLWARFGPLWA
jgi:hypothetical protein